MFTVISLHFSTVLCELTIVSKWSSFLLKFTNCRDGGVFRTEKNWWGQEPRGGLCFIMFVCKTLVKLREETFGKLYYHQLFYITWIKLIFSNVLVFWRIHPRKMTSFSLRFTTVPLWSRERSLQWFRVVFQEGLNIYVSWNSLLLLALPVNFISFQAWAVLTYGI